MALSLSLKHLCFILAIVSIATSCCKAQDAIAIVARAALCFDNRSLLSSCLSSLKPNKTAAVNTIPKNSTISKNSTTNSTMNATGFCNGPCFGETMLLLNCMEGVLSNFQFYSPGMMQGVMSVFRMACGGNRTATNSTTTQREGLNAYGGILGATNHGNEILIPMPRPVWLLIILASTLLL